MNTNQLINCPICQSKETTILLNMDCGNLDKSELYKKLIVQSCNNCGHVYNKLTKENYTGLIKYYNDEYAPINIGGSDLGGDRPGSQNTYTTNRHQQLYNLFKDYIHKEMKILDIGCAMGGMLSYLNSKNLNYLYGIDLTQKYLDIAKKNKEFCIKFGSAEDIPFENTLFDLLIIDQVMEHLINPRKAFQEAGRVLKRNGLFCIGVPNASEYSNHYFFDFYWFLMREHIQHFDLTHLEMLANSEGFELLKYNFTETPMMSEKMILPNLNVIFKYTGINKNTNSETQKRLLSINIKDYISIEQKKLNKKKRIFNKLSKQNIPLYVWGIGREFLYLYDNTDLKNCNIKKLLDANKYKQKNHTISGVKIFDPSDTIHISDNTILVITAIAHQESIKKDLQTKGFQGKILDYLEDGYKNDYS